MLENELFAVNKKHLTGKLITSTISKGFIESIELPQNESKKIVVLSAADFEERNYIDVMGETFPILVKDEVSYKGQPILAIFGEVSEDVELFCREVKISYRIPQTAETSTSQPFGEPFNWSFGNTDEYFVQGSKTLRTTFSVGSHSSNMLGDQKVCATMDKGNLQLQLETQWPVHVRRSVANVLDLPFDKVQLDLQPYFALFDQLIIAPSMLACIAAKATQKTGELIRLFAPLISWQPKMDFEFKTVVLQDGSCVAGRYKCSIDMGAFPIFPKEVCYNILSGIVPVYPMKALDVTIKILKSSTPPANFFGDLGFSMALAATEDHFSQVALAYGQQPGQWKLEQLKECGDKSSPVSESVRETVSFDNLPRTFKDVLSSSWYSRKFAVNSQKSIYLKKVSPFINYSRGVGIATGEGIIGFSRQYNAMVKYSLAVTLDKDNKVIVNTGMQAGKNMQIVWKRAIKQFLDVDEDYITFKDINDEDIIDIGPNVLSRRIGLVTNLLVKACSEIAKKKTFARLPITVTAFSEADSADSCYFSSCFGTVAVELHIDTVSLSPVIDNVWARFHMGHVFNMQQLISKARLSIFSVISEVLPNWSGKCNIDLNITQDGDYSLSSLTAAIRGLTLASLVNALSQAIGRYVNTVPITENDILAFIKGTEPAVVPTIQEDLKQEDLKQEDSKLEDSRLEDSRLEDSKGTEPDVSVSLREDDEKDETTQVVGMETPKEEKGEQE